MWGKLLLTALSAMVTTVARKVPDFTVRQWYAFREWWDGKCVAVIGPTASGKNSLFDRLRGTEPPEVHIQSRGAERVDVFNFTWPLPDKEVVRFKCKRSINVGGETDERDRYWIDSCSDADVIFYLVDVEDLLKRDERAISRIKSDAQWISSNIGRIKSESRIQILINKIDKIYDEADPINGLAAIDSRVSPAVDELEGIFKTILGVNLYKICGVSPISMTNNHLFSRYFTQVMQNVFTTGRTNK